MSRGFDSHACKDILLSISDSVWNTTKAASIVQTLKIWLTFYYYQWLYVFLFRLFVSFNCFHSISLKQLTEFPFWKVSLGDRVLLVSYFQATWCKYKPS